LYATLGLPAPTWRRVVDQFEEIVACLALAGVVLSVSWGVITRYITEQPATWASEVATLCFAWVVFFGAAACFKYKLHPSIDMLVNRLPRPLATAVRWLNHALVLGLCVFMAWFGTRFAIDSWSSPSGVLRYPLTWLYGPVALCFGLMGIRYLQVQVHGLWAIDADRETNVG
jgi:TRAP-type C4-dicarboxylate transport system permease small subunit